MSKAHGYNADLEAAHRHSSGHREEILASEVCGCFYCRKTFSPSEIEDWIDEIGGVGTTALCPRCGIDAVVGSGAGLTLTPEFLREMHEYWFGWQSLTVAGLLKLRSVRVVLLIGFVVVLVFCSGTIPFRHALQSWESKGSWVVKDSNGKQYTVSVFAKHPMRIPGDHPDIKFVVESATTRRVLAQKLTWFRFSVGEIRPENHALNVFHLVWTNHLGATFTIENGEPRLTRAYPPEDVLQPYYDAYLRARASGVCNIHNVRMEKQQVEIVYGESCPSPVSPEVGMTQFPHARRWFCGGCDEQEKKVGEQFVCPECRKAALEWVSRHPDCASYFR